MRHYLLLTTLLLLIAGSSTDAFDGNREGLVLGAGIGGTAVVTWTNDEQGFDGDDESNNGFGYLVGGGWEFTRSAQFGVYLAGARYEDNIGTSGHFHLNFVFSIVTY